MCRVAGEPACLSETCTYCLVGEFISEIYYKTYAFNTP
jgi:hypothetical protein